MTALQHFLDLDPFDNTSLREILSLANKLKEDHAHGRVAHPLADKLLAMLFEKPSTRTRFSFEAGITQLGGAAIVADSQVSQFGHGETIADTARVLSRYVDLIMIRCFEHQTLLDLAKFADVPVINGLTNFSHPCQVMADIMTIEEHRGTIDNMHIAWVGDGNNVLTSWIQAAAKFGFDLHVAAPKDFAPSSTIVDWAATEEVKLTITEDPKAAVKEAHVVMTDTWVSMGDKDAEMRKKAFSAFQVNNGLMELAHNDALFLHCLPAHRGEEVTDEVIDGRQSVVWDEAENRLHIQKAIMLWCMEKSGRRFVHTT